MATKGGKRSGSIKGKSTAAKKPVKPAPRPASRPVAATTAKPGPAAVKPARPSPAAGATRVIVPMAVPSSPPVEPTLLERAERLRDEILKTKTSHPDPWRYTAKARGWAQRAQQIVDDVAGGRSSDAARRMLDALTAELEADSDFQEARRRL